MKGYFKYERFKYKRTIQVDENYSTWGTDLNKIAFGNYTYQVDDYVYFQSNLKKIQITQGFMDYLTEKYFKKYKEEQICEVGNSLDGVGYECKCKMIDDFPEITLVLNGTNFVLNKTTLFEVYGSFCYFNLLVRARDCN